MNLTWEPDSEIHVRVDEGGEVVISANRNGLISLSNHLRALAGELSGAHVHLDEYNSLEDGSCELVLERIE